MQTRVSEAGGEREEGEVQEAGRWEGGGQVCHQGQGEGGGGGCNYQILLRVANKLLFVDNIKIILEHILYFKNYFVYSSNIQKKFFTIHFFIIL